jgi:hypothetical protein
MAAKPNDIQTELRAIAINLRNLSEQPVKDLDWQLHLFQASAYLQLIALTAASSSLGECRQKTPYAPLRPVIDSKGNFKWCCEHDPEHCSA